MSIYGDTACARLASARQFLDWPAERFAAELTAMVGWQVFADVVPRWESGQCAPPGDVLLAAEELRTRNLRGRHLQLVGSAW